MLSEKIRGKINVVDGSSAIMANNKNSMALSVTNHPRFFRVGQPIPIGTARKSVHSLGDLIFEPALFHPAHGQQIVAGGEEAVKPRSCFGRHITGIRDLERIENLTDGFASSL
jgi:hypothetical protein